MIFIGTPPLIAETQLRPDWANEVSAEADRLTGAPNSYFLKRALYLDAGVLLSQSLAFGSSRQRKAIVRLVSAAVIGRFELYSRRSTLPPGMTGSGQIKSNHYGNLNVCLH
jgi:hypothetical protein